MRRKLPITWMDYEVDYAEKKWKDAEKHTHKPLLDDKLKKYRNG